jgi:hypothetical protein
MGGMDIAEKVRSMGGRDIAGKRSPFPAMSILVKLGLQCKYRFLPCGRNSSWDGYFVNQNLNLKVN